MKVWLVWEVIDDWVDSGGGEYLNEIFLDEEKAKAYCKEMNEDEDKDEDATFEVRPWRVKEV